MVKSIEELLEEALVPVEEQPYEVPENWVWIRLGDCIELISGRDLELSDCNDKRKGIPYILGASNIDNNTFTITRWTETPTVIGKKNDILVSVKGTIGKLLILEENEIHLSRQIMAIRTVNEMNTINIYYYLKSYIYELIQKSRGVIPGISREDILDIQFPLPPLQEQYRIVTKIESLFSKIDKAKELLEEAREEYYNRKAAILAKAFRGKLTKKWREESPNIKIIELLNEETNNKKENIQDNSDNVSTIQDTIELPPDWNWITLGQIVNVKGGKRLPKGESLIDYNTGYPYLKAGDLKEGTILMDNLQYITEEVHDKIRNYTVNAGDVYITIVGACIGDVGIIPENLDGANLTENAAKLCNFSYCINNKFLARWLSSSKAQYQIKEKISSATLGKLSLARIKSLDVPLPPLEEQKQIVRILDNLLSFESKIDELTQLEDQIELLKKSILGKAFRGELGTNNSSEESAIKLINQIFKKIK